MTYYNTTNETGETLAKARSKAQTQDEYVLSILGRHHPMGYTSDEVFRLVRSKKDSWLSDEIANAMPKRSSRTAYAIKDFILQRDKENAVSLISIRRSITNLTKQGLLRKTERKRKGQSGRNQYVYEIV